MLNTRNNHNINIIVPSESKVRRSVSSSSCPMNTTSDDYCNSFSSICLSGGREGGGRQHMACVPVSVCLSSGLPSAEQNSFPDIPGLGGGLRS